MVARGDVGTELSIKESWITFDAGRSNALFGASSTNQVSSLRGYWLIRF